MTHDTPLELGKDFALQLPSPLAVFAAGEQIEALKGAKGVSWLGDAQLLPTPLEAAIPTHDLAEGRIIVIEADPAVPASIERVRKVRSTRPDLVVIVALGNADVRMVRTLVRGGVADVVGLPLDAEEILQAAVAILEVSLQEARREVHLAPIIAVTRAAGGGGATTAVTHLGRSLAEGATCCIFDLDVQYGRVCEVLGLRPRLSLADLLEAGDRLDAAYLRSVVTDAGEGLSVIAAPPDILPIEAVDGARLHEALELACREFDYVLIDMPSNLTNWSLSVLARADGVVLLCDQAVPSLRQARRRIDLFRKVGIDRANVLVVINRATRKLFGAIGMDDVERALGQPVFGRLPLDAQALTAAQDQGLLLNRAKPKSPFVADMHGLAAALRSRLQAVQSP